MPSTLRYPITRLLTRLVLLSGVAPVSAAAQQLSAEATVAITVRVQPTLAIRSVMPGIPRVESGNRLTGATVVNVESNLAYRLSVRLAAATDTSVRVFVRSASGGFELLVPGGSVTTVVSRAAGQRGHEVVCRLETSEPELLDAGRCALVYELSAEHHDTLLRSTATLPRPSDHGRRNASD